eukprot:10533682-Alexandrium_andersonii.AAC.1
MAAATFDCSSSEATASPATSPVLVGAPRQARQTPRARSGSQRSAARCPGHASNACRTSWRKSPTSRAAASRCCSKGRPAA